MGIEVDMMKRTAEAAEMPSPRGSGYLKLKTDSTVETSSLAAGDPIQVFHRASSRLIIPDFDSVFPGRGRDLNFPAASKAAARSRPRLFQTHGWFDAEVVCDGSDRVRVGSEGANPRELVLSGPRDGHEWIWLPEDGHCAAAADGHVHTKHQALRLDIYELDASGCELQRVKCAYMNSISVDLMFLKGLLRPDGNYKFVWTGVIYLNKGEKFALKVPNVLESDVWFWCENLSSKHGHCSGGTVSLDANTFHSVYKSGESFLRVEVSNCSQPTLESQSIRLKVKSRSEIAAGSSASASNPRFEEKDVPPRRFRPPSHWPLVKFKSKFWATMSSGDAEVEYCTRVPRCDIRKSSEQEDPICDVLTVIWNKGRLACGHGAGTMTPSKSLYCDWFRSVEDTALKAYGRANCYRGFSLFVEDTSDLEALTSSFASNVLVAPHKVASYFLWPGGWSEPIDRTHVVSHVTMNRMLESMAKMEAQGVLTAYPNHSCCYRTLAAKEWLAQMCQNPLANVPLCIRIPTSLCVKDSKFAAERALQMLSSLQSRRQGPAAGNDICKGMAKVGFSWSSDGVKAFHDVSSLAARIQEYVDRPNNLQSCVLVQERVDPLTIEPCVHVIHGKVAGIGYVAMSPADSGGGMEFETIHSEKDCIEKFFQGDRISFHKMRNEVDRLVKFWLDWLTYDNGELPAFTRLDFLVSYTPEKEEKVRVFTGEVCEIGVSICLTGEERRRCERPIIFDACLERQLLPREMLLALQ